METPVNGSLPANAAAMFGPISQMLEMQENINRRVHSDWRKQNRDWYRALWIECAELLNHCNWKWWRHRETDLEQIQLEVVDLWHFGMSAILNHKTSEEAARQLSLSFAEDPETMSVEQATEALACHALEHHDFNTALFHSLLRATEMDLAMLFRQYIGKNVLNLFRQDHGYLEGTYKKNWNGREDNLHLAELALELGGEDEDFFRKLYAALEERYRQADIQA